MSGSFNPDTWLVPITLTASNNKFIIIEDPGGGAASTITVTVDAGTYYLHDDSSLFGTYSGLYHVIDYLLTNGTTASYGSVTGTVTNTYAFTASTPATSTGITNGGITLTAASATYTFDIDWTSGTTMDGRWFGYKDAAPGVDESSVTSGSDEVYISDYCVRGRFITSDLGDGAAQSKTGIPRKITQRSTDRIADSVTTNWGEELDRVFRYEDIWPALVDQDRAADAAYAAKADLGTGDLNNTWYVVWDALTDGDTCIVVHNSTSDLQVDANSYEVVKLAQETPWEQFQVQSRVGADLRDVRFRVFVSSGNYEH